MPTFLRELRHRLQRVVVQLLNVDHSLLFQSLRDHRQWEDQKSGRLVLKGRVGAPIVSDRHPGEFRSVCIGKDLTKDDSERLKLVRLIQTEHTIVEKTLEERQVSCATR